MKSFLIYMFFATLVFGLERYISINNSELSLTEVLTAFIIGLGVIYTAFKFSPFKS